ncbi:sporulation and spore germination protein [Kribbella sp. VKM Ac-2571]|uniref:Gmad2 immunoglobulin-like domain-containing protein n=1 Tax=Kribbella sp. VKM Ac-2571 TaxID=2512222 RepID=UPI00105E7502|nr:Gmad2 immunoglobulin-like domain-containing protein [Kribbella sp. VKM Ac-2571]TDO69310.1 sporulation and spore germination protein [Kribbella sp. VKM Ac-2571]
MNDNNPNDPFDELMRRSLHEEADRIEPSDALPEIRARAHAQRSAARRPWLLTAGLAAAGTAAAIGAFTMLNGPDNVADDGDAVAGSTTTATGAPETRVPSVASVTPEPSQAPTQPPPTSPSAKTAGPTESGVPEPAVKSTVVPVYWLGQQVGAQKESAARLYRTWAKVSGRPAEQAVRIMTTKQPSDPDYYSVWRGAALNTVTRSNGIVTVDFKQLPKTNLDADLAKVATQQLVYTVQGALGDAGGTRVQVTEQGRAAGKLFGQVDTSQPMSRAQATEVQAFIWVTAPDDNTVVTTPVKVTGIASVFEAQVNWRIVSVKTRAVVAQGAANTSEAYKFAPFAFSVTKLPPGTYTLEVFEISAGDGTITSTDSKSIVVR